MPPFDDRQRRLTTFLALGGPITLVLLAVAVAGVVAVPLGMITAWWIARSFERRLHDARDEAAGEASQMIAEARAVWEVREKAAQVEQVRLAAVSARRTQQHARRNRELSFVLDNIDQGVFLVDFAGRIGGTRSAAVERLLGPMPSDGLLPSYVELFGHDQAAWFSVCWASVRDGLLPPELALTQMPRDFVVGGRHLELTYQIVNDRRADRVLVVVSDVSARIERERAERDQRELAGLVMRLLSDRAGYSELHAEIEQRCATMVRHGVTDLAALRRDAHTIKGIAGVAGIDSIATACHDLEDRLDDHDPVTTAAAVDRVVARWRELSALLAPFLAPRLDRFEITEAELDELVVSLGRIPGGESIARVVDSWRHEPVRARLERLASHIRMLSDTLGKGPITVEVAADNTRIAADRWPELWGALVHVVRNAVDHGLETPEERIAAGKPLEAMIALRATSRDGDLTLEIEDHGRGIDWSQVAASARAAGLPSATHEDLMAALFADGLTTRTTVTATSGRGIGLAAAHQACLDVGGDLRVDSRAGRGTRFTFMLPAGDHR